MDATQAMAYGLVDKILERKPDSEPKKEG
jgi:ATP-dependent protease ClpP protease subunit